MTKDKQIRIGAASAMAQRLNPDTRRWEQAPRVVNVPVHLDYLKSQPVVDVPLDRRAAVRLLASIAAALKLLDELEEHDRD
jgi:hypothetical protein